MSVISPHVPSRPVAGARWPGARPGATPAAAHEPTIPWGLVTLVGLLCLGWAFAVVLADWSAFFVGLAVVACVLILVDFRVGVILLVLMMPISSSNIFPHAIGGITGLNPLNVLLAGTLGSYLLYAFGAKKLLLPRPLLLLYIVPILVAGVLGTRHVREIALYFYVIDQVHFTSAIGYVRDMVIKPLLMVVFALLVGAAVARSAKPERFMTPFLVSTWIMGLMVIVYFVLSGASLNFLAQSNERAFLSPLGLHANELGRMYVIAYALLLFMWSETEEYTLKLLLLGCMGLMVIALVLTFSRSAFAGFLIVNGLFPLFRRKATALFFGCVLLAALLLFLPDAVYQRASHGFGGGANAISAGRIDRIWIPLIPDLMKSPLYGTGMGSMLWSEAVRAGRSLPVTHPHSAYLRTVLDMGLIGLALLGAYFFHAWNRLRLLVSTTHESAVLRGFYQGAVAALVSFLIMGVADGSLTPAPEQAFLWLAIGMMYGEYARRAAS
ncbi:MAG TPA: O-antigen ligase family protein [Burkholderiales bacterium]|nr:O-antigen ligase family protein [Burkholderiales bacterium]